MRKAFVPFVVLVLLLVVIGPACGTATDEGVVDHKSITGVVEGTSYTVLRNRPNDDGLPFIEAKDKDLLSHFATVEEHAIISDSLAFEIESRYDRVDYLVNIDLISIEGSGTQSYLVSREVFNQLQVGETVKFKAKQGGGIPEIDKLTGAQ